MFKIKGKWAKRGEGVMERKTQIKKEKLYFSYWVEGKRLPEEKII